MAKIPLLVALVFILVIGATGLHRVMAQDQLSCGIQKGGIVQTQSDQRQYCMGSTEGQKAAAENFQHHAKFNDSPPPEAQGLNHTAAFNEGYKNSYNDEWSILAKG